MRNHIKTVELKCAVQVTRAPRHELKQKSTLNRGPLMLLSGTVPG